LRCSLLFCTFLYFFDQIYLCKLLTCMMGLASNLTNTGDSFFYFFHFFAKKDKKEQKSKKGVFLMQGKDMLYAVSSYARPKWDEPSR